MNMDLCKSDRKLRLQSIADKIIYYLKIEVPDIVIDLTYTNTKIVSRYICIKLPGDKQYIIRVSDHANKRYDTYNYSVIIKTDEEFKLCSTVMNIILELTYYL